MLEKIITIGDKTQKNDSLNRTIAQIPRILYHGTSYHYLKFCAKYCNMIQGLKNSIYLTASIGKAQDEAIRHEKFFDDIAMILVVDTQKMDCTPVWKNQWQVEFLNLTCFAPVINLSGYNGQHDIKEWKESILYWTEEIKRVPYKDYISGNFGFKYEDENSSD